jgi:hypothetical protein
MHIVKRYLKQYKKYAKKDWRKIKRLPVIRN